MQEHDEFVVSMLNCICKKNLFKYSIYKLISVGCWANPLSTTVMVVSSLWTVNGTDYLHLKNPMTQCLVNHTLNARDWPLCPDAKPWSSGLPILSTLKPLPGQRPSYHAYVHAPCQVMSTKRQLSLSSVLAVYHMSPYLQETTRSAHFYIYVINLII